MVPRNREVPWAGALVAFCQGSKHGCSVSTSMMSCVT